MKNVLYNLLCIGSTLLAQSFIQKSEARLQELYPNLKNLEFRKYKIDAQSKLELEKKERQRFFRDELYTWKFQIDSINYYAVLDNVKGKVQAITFLTLFTDDLKVYFVDVLKYRESHGYEVKRRSFLDQFSKNNSSYYKINHNIDGISGATISVTSMTKGMNKISGLFKQIKDNFNATH